MSSVHCEIYSIVFENNDKYPPLIYVRDCQSTTGTFVNGRLIGKGPLVTAAILLTYGDTIGVGPCTLDVRGYAASQNQTQMGLSTVQRNESYVCAEDNRDWQNGRLTMFSCSRTNLGSQTRSWAMGHLQKCTLRWT